VALYRPGGRSVHHTLDARIDAARIGRGVHLVAVGGEIDLHTAPRLDEALFGAIGDGAQRVLVDLAGTTFVDSTVLGILVRAHRCLNDCGGRLVIVSDDPRILRTLALTGLDRMLSVESSLTATVADLSMDGEVA
jgi:anti-sigma B factor antagonist